MGVGKEVGDLKYFIMMKFGFLVVMSMVSFCALKAQKVDSLFFNLYTDSLKKGVYNYINVDAKLANGTWLPMTEKQLMFSSSAGTFDRNNLIIDTSYKGETVKIKVVLKADPAVWKEITVYLKKYLVEEKLPSAEEVTRPRQGGRNKKGVL